MSVWICWACRAHGEDEVDVCPECRRGEDRLTVWCAANVMPKELASSRTYARRAGARTAGIRPRLIQRTRARQRRSSTKCWTAFLALRGGGTERSGGLANGCRRGGHPDRAGSRHREGDAGGGDAISEALRLTGLPWTALKEIAAGRSHRIAFFDLMKAAAALG